MTLLWGFLSESEQVLDNPGKYLTTEVLTQQTCLQVTRFTSAQLSRTAQISVHHSKQGHKFFATELKFEASRTCGSVLFRK